ncbi:hypothetical protein O0S10_03495, partial [Methanocorpusculum sp. MG]
KNHQKKRNSTMDTITTILIIGIAANGLAFAALILAPPLYAWTDRWLDRTHKTTANEDRD